MQFADRANEEQSSCDILPVAIEDIAGNDENALLAIVSLTSASTARRPA
jgi:hypothetical protein